MIEPSTAPSRLTDRLRSAIAQAGPLSVSQRRTVIVLLAIAVGIPFVSHIKKALRTDHGDWLSIYHIGRHSIDTHQLESPRGAVLTQRFPPISRPMIMLLAWPPKPIAAVLSFLLFAALYAASVRIIARYNFPGILGDSRRAPWIAAALVAIIALPYIWADLVNGNLTSVLLASVTGAYALAARGRRLAAGLVLSVGIMLKMIPALCLLHFLLRRQWRVAWGVAAGIVLIGLIPTLLIFGPAQLRDYTEYWYQKEFTKVGPMRVIDERIECSYQNQAVVRTLVRLLSHTNAGHLTKKNSEIYVNVAELSNTAIKAVYLAAMAATGVCFLWLTWRARILPDPLDNATAYALCVGSMIWFTPYAGVYYFSLAAWPAAALLRIWLFGQPRRESRVAQVALAFWLAMIPALASEHLRAMGLTMWGMLALLCGLAVAIVFSTRRQLQTPPL